MPQSRYHKARSEQVVAIRFRIEASAEEVIARLFEAIRGIELTLLKVVGDGHRVYPSEVGDPDRSASSWRAELFWHSPTLMSGWQLESFQARAEIFLELRGRAWLEVGPGERIVSTTAEERS